MCFVMAIQYSTSFSICRNINNKVLFPCSLTTPLTSSTFTVISHLSHTFIILSECLMGFSLFGLTSSALQSISQICQWMRFESFPLHSFEALSFSSTLTQLDGCDDGLTDTRIDRRINEASNFQNDLWLFCAL